MAGALRKTMLYLGLADDRGEDEQVYDDEYDDEVGEDVVGDYQAEVTPLHRSLTSRGTASRPTKDDLRRIVTVHPRSYEDARLIGDAFRSGTPVIINLSNMDAADAKRVLDFSTGVTYGLNGAIERVTNNVFLLSPENVEVKDEDSGKSSSPRMSFYDEG